jgi:hypothetical protein
MDSQQHALQAVQNTEFFPEWFIHGVESEFNPTVAADLPSLFETSFESSEGANSAAFPAADDLPEHPITAITSGQGCQSSSEVPQPNSMKRYFHQIFFVTDERTRRTFGPVMGNNKTGRRGKLICLECRKIRSKVYVQLYWANLSVPIPQNLTHAISVGDEISSASRCMDQRKENRS